MNTFTRKHELKAKVKYSYSSINLHAVPAEGREREPRSRVNDDNIRD